MIKKKTLSPEKLHKLHNYTKDKRQIQDLN